MPGRASQEGQEKLQWGEGWWAASSGLRGSNPEPDAVVKERDGDFPLRGMGSESPGVSGRVALHGKGCKRSESQGASGRAPHARNVLNRP